jgi:hypothetical protein
VVEYFTKWIEAKPLVNIAAVRLKRFFWQNIICCFEVPRKITVDNAKQFDCHMFKYFCHKMGVKAAFTSVYHLQSNGAVEKANTLIFSDIKKILENQPKGKWAEELPRAVWSHNTSVCRATKFTPLKLLYREELVTLEEIKLHSARTRAEVIHNPTEAESKDLIEPERMKAVENLQSYQNETIACRDKKSKAKAYRSQKSSVVVKPTHGGIWKIRTKVDRKRRQDLDYFDWPTPRVGCWSSHGTATISVIFTFNLLCKSRGSVIHKQAFANIFIFSQTEPVLFFSWGKPMRA